MTVDSPTPLATVAQMTEGPYADLVRDYSPQALTDLMVEATRELESRTDRRLAPFTLTESCRLDGIDPDEYADGASIPLDLQGSLGRSYAYALGASNLVRHCWLREYAPRFQEMWAYSNVQITVIRSYGGTQALSASQVIGPEPDSGHVWFQLGSFIPVGTLGRTTYSGGYTTVPADLVRGCIYLAAETAVAELDPAARPDLDLTGKIDKIVGTWKRS